MKKKIKVVAAFISEGEKFLITKKDDLWEFPGGKVKEKESLKEALKREIKEELGVDIEVLKQIFLYEKEGHIFYFFLSKIKKGKIILKEHGDFKWIRFEEAKKFKFYEPDEKFLSSMAYFK